MTARLKIKQGELQGSIAIIAEEETYASYKGIPFAKPPVGSLRFKPPQLADSWTGVRDATEHRDVCIQNDVEIGEIIGSEDCLYLNVYTPFVNNEDKTKYPVMVFIHGGGYQFGSGNEEYYGPKYLMRKNVVIVTFNYRLGALGFLCLHNEDIPGNAGLKDQVAAMKWVKENISDFGGDSNNITLFGESAGSASVTFHLFSPLSKGLFHKAIAQSGVCTNYRIEGEDPVEIAFNVGKYLGRDTNDHKELHEFLLSVPITDFIDIPFDYCVNAHTSCYDVLKPELNMIFTPVIEKCYVEGQSFITETIEELISKGEFYDVPLVIGCNSGEGMLAINQSFKQMEEVNNDFIRFVPPKLHYSLNAEQLNDIVTGIKQFYFDKETFNERTKENMINLRSDILYIHPIIKFVRRLSEKLKSPIYFYVVSMFSHLNAYTKFYECEGSTLTCHADELHYLFTADLTSEVFNFTENSGKMIDNFTTLWTNIAKYSNPAPVDVNSNLPKWTPIEKDRFCFLSISDNLEVQENPFKERMDFWDDIHQKFQAADKNF